jgi:Ion channel
VQDEGWVEDNLSTATPRQLRRRFLAVLWRELRIVWPILSGLIAVQLALGMVVGYFEQWPLSDAAYFTFVTGLTIGYGDLVPLRLVTRMIALVIGLIGILQTGLVAALGVRALQETMGR